MKHRLLFLLALTALPTFVTAQDATVRVIGRVVSAETGEAVAGAVVRAGSMQYTTDQRGRFQLSLPGAATMEFTVEMIGYATRMDSVKLSAGTNDVLVRLSRNPVKLPPVTVSVRSSWLEENGYYERRYQSGLSGHYIDRAEIEKRNPAFMTDLFHGVSGVKVHNLGMSMRVLQFSRNESGRLVRPPGNDNRLTRLQRLEGCQPYVYIDGRAHYDISEDGRNYVLDFNLLNPDAIEALRSMLAEPHPSNFATRTAAACS